jgi:hypothetical protein
MESNMFAKEDSSNIYDIVIYIGSCGRDIDVYEYLINSIETYNVDKIPVYTSVRDEDYGDFVTRFSGRNITFLKDSDVYPTTTSSSWHKQQIIKMNFWKQNISRNILQMDSDSFFIKNFYKNDFLVNSTHPYTIMHEHKELREFFAKTDAHKVTAANETHQEYMDVSDNIRRVFGTSDIKTYWDFGHTPLIISTRVWEFLHKKYIEPNNISYEQLIEYASNDQQWYGETILVMDNFPIYPKENLFKVFHYKLDYDLFISNNRIEDLRYNYLGIVIQSNWSADGEQYKSIYDNFFDTNKYPI